MAKPRESVARIPSIRFVKNARMINQDAPTDNDGLIRRLDKQAKKLKQYVRDDLDRDGFGRKRA